MLYELLVSESGRESCQERRLTGRPSAHRADHPSPQDRIAFRGGSSDTLVATGCRRTRRYARALSRTHLRTLASTPTPNTEHSLVAVRSARAAHSIRDADSCRSGAPRNTLMQTSYAHAMPPNDLRWHGVPAFLRCRGEPALSSRQPDQLQDIEDTARRRLGGCR
jgi:hypothetical protein